MKKLLARLEAIQAQGSRLLPVLVILGSLTLGLLLAAVIGAFAVGGNNGKVSTVASLGTTTTAAGETTTTASADTTLTTDTTAAAIGAVPGGAKTTTKTTAKPKTTNTTTGGSGGGGSKPDLPSQPGATRTGVSETEIKWGLHAPKTTDGAPLPLADAPLKGVGIYLNAINAGGGVNGRKINEIFADDRYTVDGAKTASDSLINDNKVFFITGTLGIDQVAYIALKAKESGTPYLGGGGSEPLMKDSGMFQILGSYDTFLVKLAKFLATESAKPPCATASTCTPDQSIYSGKKRVAASALDSKYIAEPIEAMKQTLAANGMTFVGTVPVPKYTDSSNTHNYGDQISKLEGMKAEIVVPAQDPLTTGDMVRQCVAQQCSFKWTMADFAHDGDVALDLTGGQWTGVRGLATGCYYTLFSDPAKAAKCGQLKAAHDIWVAANGESDWNKDGQGGIAGYQFTHGWLKALTDAGSDLTRERFVAALNTYDGYNDIISGPLTYKGSPNITHGADRFAIFEGTATPGPQGSNRANSWKQISDGLLSDF